MKKPLLLLTAALTLQNVMAMPDPKADITNLINNVDLTGIGTVYGDDDKDSKTIYVKPGNMEVTGQYAQINGSPSCQQLHKLRETTHRYPTKEEFQSVLRNTSFYSPSFENNVGVRARNANLLSSYIQAKNEARNYRLQHKEIYSAFQESKLKLDTAQANLKYVRDQIKVKIDGLSGALALAENDTERAEIRATFKAQIRELELERLEAQAKVDRATEQHAEDYAAWAPYGDQLDWLVKVQNSIAFDFKSLQQLSKETFDQSKKAIEALEKKPVGLASVSYSLNVADKVAELNKRIKQKGLDYQAVPLDIFHVKANAILSKNIDGLTDSATGVSYSLQSINISKDLFRSEVTSDNEVVYEPNAEVMDEKGNRQPYKLLLTDFDEMDASSMAFEMPGTMGAFCGYPQGKEVTYQYSSSDGDVYSITTQRQKYQYPKPDEAKFVQDVAINYSYFVKAEPIKGECSLNINKTSNFTRNSGSKSGWRWFRRYKHSWDNTKHILSSKMGIDCKLKVAPQGYGPDEAKLVAEAMERALYQDIYSMFLLEYGKKYKIEPIAHNDQPLAVSTFFSRIGSGVMNLCGHNKVCQFTGVVIKSLDELVGRRHSGSTSNYTQSEGTIYRKLEKDGFYMESDSLKVSMKVCINDKCKAKK